MSLIGDFSMDEAPKAPNEKYVDDQAMQEDHRDNRFVGATIETACAVYDTMFDALKYVIRGKADAISKMDKAIGELEKRCNKIVEKYRELLEKLKDADAAISAGISVDLIKEAFDILDSNPVLRRYVGEANYWVLWDTLATLSSQGAALGAGVASNIKDAIKGTIYAILSMTNGLMRFEAYISQLTQLWGYLYSKAIWLPLTDSICPQVTCAYYYKPADYGQLEGSDPNNSGPDKENPVPGPGAFAPMPIPIFDYAKYSPAEIVRIFSYDNPDTWYVLTRASRQAFDKAYKYWRSNYTNASSVNELLSAASRKLTGGKFTAGFGRRKHNYPGGTPLRVGTTFSQLDTAYNESFPAMAPFDEDLAAAYDAVDSAFIALISKMRNASVTAERDSLMRTRLDPAYADNYIGTWVATMGHVSEFPAGYDEAYTICRDLVAGLEEFSDYMAAIRRLSTTYKAMFDVPYHIGIPVNWGRGSGEAWESAPLQYLVGVLSELSEDAGSSRLSSLLKAYNDGAYMMGAPYMFYTDAPNMDAVYSYAAFYTAYGENSPPIYSDMVAGLSYEINADEELGRKVDGGRKPLFAAIGVYGDLKGLYAWNYRIMPYEAFRGRYTRIKGSYHVYYRNDDPARVLYADHLINVGLRKYIAVCDAAATDTISRGNESFTAYIFPGETCSVYPLPPEEGIFGASFPSFASLQRVDAVDRATGSRYMYGLTTNAIPKWPRYVDPEKWSIMDLIHELWLLADSLAVLCGDGGRRKDELSDLLNQFGLICPEAPNNGPEFIGQLPGDDGKNVRLEFRIMNEFAVKIKDAISAVYAVRDEVLAATRAW